MLHTLKDMDSWGKEPIDGDFRDSSGNFIQLCALEEIAPKVDTETYYVSAPAIATLGGISVCRKHLEVVEKMLRDGQPMTLVVMQALAGEV